MLPRILGFRVLSNRNRRPGSSNLGFGDKIADSASPQPVPTCQMQPARPVRTMRPTRSEVPSVMSTVSFSAIKAFQIPIYSQ